MKATVRVLLLVTVGSILGSMLGCSKPQAANIALRKENQALRSELDQLRRQRAADQTERVVVVNGAAGVPLDRLFTSHGLRFGRLTAAHGSQLLVYVVPTDQTGDELKAAGAFKIDAFDLSRGTEALIASWNFTPEQSATHWNGAGMVYGYVLPCPLPTPVAAESEYTLRVAFTDALTGRTLTGSTKATARP